MLVFTAGHLNIGHRLCVKIQSELSIKRVRWSWSYLDCIHVDCIVIYFIRRALYKNMWEYQNLNLLKRLNTFIFAHFYNDYLIWKHVYLFRYEMPIMRSVALKVLFLFHLITRAFKLTKKAWIHHYFNHTCIRGIGHYLCMEFCLMISALHINAWQNVVSTQKLYNVFDDT